ncbi:MAG: HNH endonuclease [Mycoplasmataceae bacterium]|nr:HNH endonuclease [Mycoplasmataceae bacterium]
MEANLNLLFKHFDIVNSKIQEKVKSLCKWLFTNASNKNFYYPYKPYALLTILNYWKNDSEIAIDKSFIDAYKKLLSDDPIFNSLPIKIKKLSDYGLMLNPLASDYWKRGGGKTSRKQNTFFTIDKENKKIIINSVFNANTKLLLTELCVQCVLKCTNNKLLLNSYELEKQTNSIDWSEIFKKTKYRIHQADWAQIIKMQNNNECLICKIKFCLEAAHIKPYAKCRDDKDGNEYNTWNGICLCSNCHKLFDNYLMLKKEGNEYVFFIRKDIDKSERIQIEALLDKFNEEVNKLCSKNEQYTCFFDYLALQGNAYA